MSDEEVSELNAWIAEHVFNLGATVGLMKRGCFYCSGAAGYTKNASTAGRFTLEEAKKHECIRGEDDDVIIVRWDTPRYTTDPAAAMEVLEKCIAAIEDVHTRWNMRRKCYEVWGGGCRAISEKLPIAICLFAKALFEKGGK